MAARFSHSRSLFITDVGPMRFYVRPGPLKRQLSPLISHGGGIVCRVQEPGAFLLSEPGQAEGIQYMANTYITDCVRRNRRLSPRSYRLVRRAGAPDKKHLWERKGPEEGTGGVREGPAGATPASCDGNRTIGGPREEEPHTALKSEPAVNGSGTGVFTTGAPASRDLRPSTTGAPASRDLRPSTTGAPASRDLSLSTTGAPASRDLSLSTTEAPASRDLGPSTTGAPASRDLGPSTTGAPASRDRGPSTTGAPASRDRGPSTTGAPASRDRGPSITGAPASRDRGPSITGAPASRDRGPSTTGAPASRDLRPSTTGAPASRDLRPSTTGAPASRDRGPSTTGAPASRDRGPSTTGAPASRDLGPSTTGAPASRDLGPSTTGAPASRDLGPSTTGAPASRDLGPSTTGAPASRDLGPSTTGAPASRDRGPSTTGAPASRDLGPSTTVAPASRDLGPSTEAPVRQDEQVVEGRGDDAQRAGDTGRRSEVRVAPPKRRAAVLSGWRGPMRRRMFSREEDIAIFQYVRENEAPTRLVTGTLLWKELEQKGLLSRTWQAMKTRYTRYILQNADRYNLPATSKTAPARTPRRPADQHPDLLPADITDTGGRRLRSLSRRIVTAGTPKTVQESGDSSWEGGYRGAESTSMQLPNTQENQDIDSSEDIHIFEIANMEFEVEDEDSGCNVKVPLISPGNPVISEVIAAPQVDDAASSPDTSDSEGLQDSMADMMKEFKLDVCQVTQALLKNNGEVGSTRVFLRTGLRPDGFPIWEYMDDVELQRGGPVVWPRLAGKYGSDNVAKRVAFLASYTSSVVHDASGSPSLQP